MLSKIAEKTGVEEATLNQSQKTKVIFENYISQQKTALHHNLEQDLYVKRNLEYFSDFNSLCRSACNGSNSYNCDFFYITLRLHNHISAETNYYSRKSLVKEISEKFVRRINFALGIKREDKVGNKNKHYVAHASTFIEARTKHGNKDFHHSHIVLGLYHTQTKKLNELLVREALDGSYVGEEFGEAKKLSQLLHSVKVQRINIGSREKRYSELKRVLHYSAKHCHRDDDEFENFQNIKITKRKNDNDRHNRLSGRTNRRTISIGDIDTQGFQL